jgi:hypothetical protein
VLVFFAMPRCCAYTCMFSKYYHEAVLDTMLTPDVIAALHSIGPCIARDDLDILCYQRRNRWSLMGKLMKSGYVPLPIIVSHSVGLCGLSTQRRDRLGEAEEVGGVVGEGEGTA